MLLDESYASKETGGLHNTNRNPRLHSLEYPYKDNVTVLEIVDVPSALVYISCRTHAVETDTISAGCDAIFIGDHNTRYWEFKTFVNRTQHPSIMLPAKGKSGDYEAFVHAPEDLSQYISLLVTRSFIAIGTPSLAVQWRRNPDIQGIQIARLSLQSSGSIDELSTVLGLKVTPLWTIDEAAEIRGTEVPLL